MGADIGLAVLDAGDLISRTSAFLYRASAHSDKPMDELSEKEMLNLLDMAEHLLVYIGVLPEDWEYIAQETLKEMN